MKTVPPGTKFRQLVNKALRHELRGEPLPPLYSSAAAVDVEGNRVYALVRVTLTVEQVQVEHQPCN